ncbi:MAG: hypothetical protein HY897_20045 [Deltaproteobacteria bacterium]|nr:hypothetical protein [Deltaproteobacteria bacterium]
MLVTAPLLVASMVAAAPTAALDLAAPSETDPGDASILLAEKALRPGKGPRTYRPSDILRKVAAGADTMKLVTYPLNDRPEENLLTVSDRKAIAELLAAIETPPVANDGSSTSHGCSGHPIIRLYRKTVLLTTFSFDHVHFLRPLSGNLWETGDVEVTRKSAGAIARWFKKRGYSVYQDEIDENQREADKLEAFYAVFPASVSAVLKSTSLGSSNDYETGDPDPLAVAVPDDVKRAGMICRALGILDDRWFAYSKPDDLLLLWSRNIPPKALVAAIDAFRDGGPELTGAARVFFDNRLAGEALVHRVDSATADRLGARLAAHVFSGSNERNARQLPRHLARLTGPGVDRVLRTEAARVSAAKEGGCPESGPAIPALSCMVVLSGRRTADPAIVEAAGARSWQCAANKAAFRISDALASNKLPDYEDVKMADAAAGLAILERLKESPTRDAIDFAFDVLLKYGEGEVKRDTIDWLSGLMKPARPGEKPGRHTEGELRRWWGDACQTWQTPRPEKNNPIDGGVPR